VDETGWPVPNATVIQYWRNYSVERSGHEARAVSDGRGLVSFPERRVWACTGIRILGPVWNVANYLHHAGLGPRSQIIARHQQKQGDVVYQPGKPLPKVLVIREW
jgi:hypothetical protein